ncbi:tRNA lysidine(34) synthetase TilS [Eubacterium sp. AF22-8LB]|uniref:tRNA lysidine(34) synthetase TilS n=1 Tax=Eubacterium sp. AF22-8LB TaxID=2292232 RepID=UPI000E4CCFC7|nr:tRNA lysidine(34) synthetase TilS [Eubacterium sp. AF22-8LB]RGS31670.1 tRNA lysidine(34) synthetase TilS [Eubacterium sp. AF22-8LB]
MLKCVVACSGGPDSMALLDQLNKQGRDIVVAHVNYKHRDTADRDENIVKEYCQKYGIPVRVCYPIHEKGNFQAWARDVRYAFFEEVADEFDTKLLYVAHQMDDVIETYFFQKKRNMICDYYGLKQESSRHGYKIIRPLLSYTKVELQMYCVENGVSFGIDESNLTNHYTRNVIRHTQIEKMSRKEKEEWILKIEEENAVWKKQRNQINLFLKGWNYDIQLLLNQENAWLYLDSFLFNTLHHHFSRKYMEELCIQLKSNVLIEIENYLLERHNNKLYFLPKPKDVNYKLNALRVGEYEDFTILSQGNRIEGFSVEASDFPLIIRRVRANDSIKMRFGNKNVHRFFVDRKISKIQRKYWLIVENKLGHVIFVPGLGCDVEHYSQNQQFYFKINGLD